MSPVHKANKVSLEHKVYAVKPVLKVRKATLSGRDFGATLLLTTKEIKSTGTAKHGNWFVL